MRQIGALGVVGRLPRSPSRRCAPSSSRPTIERQFRYYDLGRRPVSSQQSNAAYGTTNFFNGVPGQQNSVNSDDGN